MKIGIKYCGGCNPRYDRTREVKKLMKNFPDETFTYHPEDEPCDVLLFVCGCQTGCAAQSDLKAQKTFPIRSPREAVKVTKELKEWQESLKAPEKRIIAVGDTASLTKECSEKDIAAFANTTGDYGRLHTDPAFAASLGFAKPVVQGMFTASLMSTIMGMTLPGAGTLLMDGDLKFISPVFAGNTVTATITVTEIKEQKRWYICTLEGSCTNEDGVTVATGTWHQLLMKNIFEVKEG